MIGVSYPSGASATYTYDARGNLLTVDVAADEVGDAGTPHGDAGPPLDAGPEADAGARVDAGFGPDSGLVDDAGLPLDDAGPPLDDAGLPVDGGAQPPPPPGCSCSQHEPSPTSAWPALFLVSLVLARLRARRGTALSSTPITAA